VQIRAPPEHAMTLNESKSKLQAHSYTRVTHITLKSININVLRDQYRLVNDDSFKTFMEHAILFWDRHRQLTALIR
jgi:hypothetical protein